MVRYIFQGVLHTPQLPHPVLLYTEECVNMSNIPFVLRNKCEICRFFTNVIVNKNKWPPVRQPFVSVIAEILKFGNISGNWPKYQNFEILAKNASVEYQIQQFFKQSVACIACGIHTLGLGIILSYGAYYVHGLYCRVVSHSCNIILDSPGAPEIKLIG